MKLSLIISIVKIQTMIFQKMDTFIKKEPLDEESMEDDTESMISDKIDKVNVRI